MTNVIIESKFPEHGLSVRLSLFTYIEANVHVVYSPALDLYGYGNDEYEARHSFDVNLREYVTYTSHKKTLEKDLKKYGWTLVKKSKTVRSPEVTTLISSNEDFRELLNSKAYKKFDLNIELPVFA
jgi:hypothetical protein